MTKSWMSYVISKPLVMLAHTASAAILRIENLEFSKKAGGDACVDDVASVDPNDAWPVDRHSLPIPLLEPKHFVIEFVRKSLCRNGVFLL